MSTTSLYNGDIELIFNEGRHCYTVNGVKADGVTTVLSIINKPALMIWAANLASEFVRERLKPGVSLDEIEIKDLCDEAKNAHRKRKEKAGDIGSMIHAWCEQYAKSADRDNLAYPVNEQVANGCRAFVEFCKNRGVIFMDSERRIYSKKYNYAGTFDLLVEIGGKIYLADIKTGSGIYPEYFYQTSAYHQALVEEVPSINIHGHIIINCKKDGTLDVEESFEYEKNVEAFNSALVLYRRGEEIKKPYSFDK